MMKTQSNTHWFSRFPPRTYSLTKYGIWLLVSTSADIIVFAGTILSLVPFNATIMISSPLSSLIYAIIFSLQVNI